MNKEMKRLTFIAFAICAVALFLSACGEKKYKGFSKTKTGLYYKITTKNDAGRTPQEGDIISFTASYEADFDSTLNFPPVEMRAMMGPSAFEGDVLEAYSLLKEGEEGEFYIKADSFFLHFTPMGIPPSVKPKDMLHFKIKLTEVKTAEEFEVERAAQEKERERMLEEKKAEEKEALEKYIAEQKITVKPTASGLYYIETVKGKGEKADIGKKVEVHYKGTFLDGTVFDSSEGKDPFSFVVGAEQVIKGWDEGIALMREGGKAKFIIPSVLAYGNGGGRMPPYASLVFEVELLKVSNPEAVISVGQ
jgi:FKBP-type peptidyl-prolyl cis-trans isomerase